MKYIVCAFFGYIVGIVNPSYIIAKIKGFDIRTKGSGNAGASNALILFGKLTGALCALFDISKAFFVVMLAECIYPDFRYAFVTTGVFCVVGHIFPFYMKFKGGKGLASLSGIVLYYDWKVFLVLLACAVVTVLITEYLCFVPMLSSVAFSFIYLFFEKDIVGSVMLLLLSLVIALRHAINLRRIVVGTEMRLSYLWKPQNEIERLKTVVSDDADALEKHLMKK